MAAGLLVGVCVNQGCGPRARIDPARRDILKPSWTASEAPSPRGVRSTARARRRDRRRSPGGSAPSAYSQRTSAPSSRRPLQRMPGRPTCGRRARGRTRCAAPPAPEPGIEEVPRQESAGANRRSSATRAPCVRMVGQVSTTRSFARVVIRAMRAALSEAAASSTQAGAFPSVWRVPQSISSTITGISSTAA